MLRACGRITRSHPRSTARPCPCPASGICSGQTASYHGPPRRDGGGKPEPSKGERPSRTFQHPIRRDSSNNASASSQPIMPARRSSGSYGLNAAASDTDFRSISPAQQASSGGRRAPTTSRKLAQDLGSTSRSSRRFEREVPPHPHVPRSTPESAPARPHFLPPLNTPHTPKTPAPVPASIFPFSAYSILPALKVSIATYLPHREGAITPPTAIQAMSLQHFVGSATKPLNKRPMEGGQTERHEVLLSSETGSGKTLAYLLPLLHHLKRTDPPRAPPTPLGVAGEVHSPLPTTTIPRAIILAPTHELTRQLTQTTKALLHDVKLRAAGMSSIKNQFGHKGEIDVLVGTSRSVTRAVEGEHINLEMCEWVVVDEADVLLGPDFEAETRGLIRKIYAARESMGMPKPSIVLSTATVPPSLTTVAKADFPEMVKILSPNLHRLPAKLKTRFVAWSGSGNNLADVAHEVKRVLAADAMERAAALERAQKTRRGDAREEEKGKVLIFCNTPSKVQMLEKVLREKEILATGLTGEGEQRVRGSNGALDAFLLRAGPGGTAAAARPSPGREPRVLVTTSLLSRGLDFSPAVKTVFLVDEPRDVLDFMHRAGRTGRAGRLGEVVVFGAGQRSILGQKTKPGEALTKFKKQLGRPAGQASESGLRFAGPRQIRGSKPAPRPIAALRSYSTASTMPGSSKEGLYEHPAMVQLRSEMSGSQPCFGARGDEIDILQDPSAFHQRLLQMIKSAKRRILISTLYIGTEQHELIEALRSALVNSPTLRVSIITDLLRSTREQHPKPSTASMLLPLVEEFPDRVEALFYRSPKLNGLLEKVVPRRFDEGWGLWHCKWYGADDEVIMSGANLSSSYFTNRQDRYWHIRNTPTLLSYLQSLVRLYSQYSYRLHPDPRPSSSPHYVQFLYKGSKAALVWTEPSIHPRAFAPHARATIAAFQKSWKDLRRARRIDVDTLIWPMVQAGVLGTSEEESSLGKVFQQVEAASADETLETRPLVDLTSGYFGLYAKYKKAIFEGHADFRIVAASPEANGFFGSAGVSGLIPEGYTLLESRFQAELDHRDRTWTDAEASGVQLSEWRREGWTYHAKGIWISPRTAGQRPTAPIATFLGSSNLSTRSIKLDTELSLLVMTESSALRKAMEAEIRNLRKHKSAVDAATWQRPDRRVRFMTKLLVALGVEGML